MLPPLRVNGGQPDFRAAAEPRSVASGSGQPEKPAKKTGGRRDVREMEIPEERIELVDDKLEGVVKRLGFEESYKLAWRRGGMVRLVVARAKY